MNLDVQPDPLTGGGKATVTISGGTPNATVTVSIENADTPPKTDSIQVKLDGNGDGSGEWDVNSAWTWASFAAEGASPITRVIVAPLGG